jgi:hypothetical protein
MPISRNCGAWSSDKSNERKQGCKLPLLDSLTRRRWTRFAAVMSQQCELRTLTQSWSTQRLHLPNWIFRTGQQRWLHLRRQLRLASLFIPLDLRGWFLLPQAHSRQPLDGASQQKKQALRTICLSFLLV